MRPPILRHRIVGWVDPAAAFSILCGDRDRAFWLDSGAYAETGMSYLGVGTATMTASVSESRVRIDADPGSNRQAGTREGTVFEMLRTPCDGGGELAPVPIGWIGWLGYELRHQTMPETPSRARTSPPGLRDGELPDASLVWVDRLIAFDHAARTVELVALGRDWAGPLADWRDEAVAGLGVALDMALDEAVVGLGAGPSAALDMAWKAPDVAPVVAPGTGRDAAPGTGLDAAPESTPDGVTDPARASAPTGASARRAAGVPRDRLGTAPTARWRDTPAAYLAKIDACLEAIREGEAYQLCLTDEVTVDVHPDPVGTWLALREANPSHHGGFLRMGGTCLLSSSPETFLSVGLDRIASSRPIKGTRPRGATEAEDARLRDELHSNEKERAENLMIVDLMRNDLGRVCDFETVTVPELFAVETYAHVHQLVSTVRGRLAEGRDSIDAVLACFPAGSMTGAPKLRATAILDELEGRDRGPYSGAFGWFGVDGSVELAMTIRSIVLTAQGARIGAGGGITSASDPHEELLEVQLKAAALLAVLGVDTGLPGARPAAAGPPDAEPPESQRGSG